MHVQTSLDARAQHRNVPAPATSNGLITYWCFFFRVTFVALDPGNTGSKDGGKKRGRRRHQTRQKLVVFGVFPEFSQTQRRMWMRRPTELRSYGRLRAARPVSRCSANSANSANRTHTKRTTKKFIARKQDFTIFFARMHVCMCVSDVPRHAQKLFALQCAR